MSLPHYLSSLALVFRYSLSILISTSYWEQDVFALEPEIFSGIKGNVFNELSVDSTASGPRIATPIKVMLIVHSQFTIVLFDK